MPTSTPSSRRSLDRWYVIGILVASVAFGGFVLYKSAYLKRPQGDFGCFARAGWAIRQGGEPLYRVMDDNNWHYNYPPVFAICVTPLADPPRRQTATTVATVLGLSASATPYSPLLAASVTPANEAPFVEDTGHYLPYPVSIALFYCFSVGLLVVVVRFLGSAVEGMLPKAEGDGAAHRRWWSLRLLPVLACVVPIGLTLMRGQVQILLLLMLSGFIVGLVRGRRFTAGMCLSAAIALKLFPAFLLIAPLVRRDWRCLMGCTVGLFVGLVLVPVAVMGPSRTFWVYKDYAKVLIGPALGLSSDPLREKELVNATGTQSQSFQVILHKTIYLGRADIPPQPAGWMKLLHLLIAATMTGALFWGEAGLGRASGQLLFGKLVLLTMVMVMVCPVCHLHYFIVTLPLFMIVRARMETKTDWRGYRLWIVLTVTFVLALSVPMIPGVLILRDVGVPLAGALACWFAGLVALWKEPAEGQQMQALGRAA